MKKLYQRFIAMLIVISLSMSAILPTRNITYAATAEEDEANLFERAISHFLLLGGLSMYALIGIATGYAENDDGSPAPMTIESLFFNRYEKTRLALFGDSAGTNDKVLTDTLKTRINDTFSLFTKIAVVVYLMMLVYIGIRILLNTGTAKNAKYKEFLVYWVQGVAILFLFPFVIKYAIQINNAFVEFIYNNKETIFAISEQVEPAGIKIDGDTNTMSGFAAFKSVVKQFLTDGTDYMSKMYQEAADKGWLVYSLCFLVMLKQMVTLLIVYFKRLLITIFLITVFPLVTISYAFDKLGDGKSQAFGNWCKEFVLNVFVQSFHAIAYVIGMALIVKIGESGDIADSWLLVLILITFITKGDDILKNVFNVKGGGANTVQSVGKTALQTKGAMKLVQDGANLVSNTVGKNSKLAEFGQHASVLASAGRDYASEYLSASNAMMREEFFPEPVPVVVPGSENAMRIDPSTIESNLSDERRQEILSEILSIMDIEDDAERELKLEEFKQTLESDEDALKFVEALFKAGAGAAAAAVVTGDLQVDLDQRIEIILEQLRNGKLAGNRDLINKLKMANEVKFKKPEHAVLLGLTGRRANTAGRNARGGTRKKGDRYSGTFTQTTGLPMNRTSGANTASGTVAGGVRPGLRYKIARTTANTIKRVKATNKIIGMEKKAVKDVRALRRIERKLKDKNLSALERSKLEREHKKISAGRTLQALRAQREAYAAKGIYFVGIGRTQRTLNRIAGRDAIADKSKLVLSKAKNEAKKYTYKNLKARMETNKNVRNAAKEVIELKRKRFTSGKLSYLEEKRLLDGEALVKRHAKERGPRHRMTIAQHMLNRGTNKIAVLEAKKALELRKQSDLKRKNGDIKGAAKLLSEAKTLEKRVMHTRGRAIKGTKLRRATKAQRILDKGQQEYSLEKLRAIREKSPDRLTEAEKKILNRSNQMRKELRAKGVVLSRGSKVEREYNAANRMTKKQELGALKAVASARATMAGKMIRDRVLSNRTGDYTAEKKKIEDASKSLRKRGIIIRDSRTLASIDKKTASYRNYRDTAGDRKQAKRDLKENNRTTLEELRTLSERRKNAERALKRANNAVKRAKGGDEAALQRARDREKAAITRLRLVQEDHNDLIKRNSEFRKQLRESGVALSNMRFSVRTSKKLEKEAKKAVVEDYQKALRRAAAADRKLERVDFAVAKVERKAARHERREGRIDKLVDGATKINLSPVRKMALAQQAKREATRAERESPIATKLSEVMDRQKFARESSEAAALYRSVSQATIQANNIATGRTTLGNRIMDANSQTFHRVVTSPARTRDAIDTFVTNNVDGVKTFVNSTKDAAKTTWRNTRDGATDVWTTVTQPGELVKAVREELYGGSSGVGGSNNTVNAPVISPEVAELAARRRTNTGPKITKVHTSPPETPAPSSGSSGGGQERETVVVIRDSNEGYTGPLSGKNVLSVNSKKDYDKAKKLLSDAKTEVTEKRNKDAADSTSFDDKVMRDAVMLAASVVAINQSSNGDYTASEIVGHIDNIKAIMKDLKPGTPEYDVCSNLLTKLKYNLDDYESNVRIQVLNDPSLIDSADPRREGIIDSSISHVKSLPSDEVLLSMLRYEPGELQEGYTPIARSARTGRSIDSFIATGIATGYDEEVLRESFAESLRERRRQERQAEAEKALNEAGAALKKEAWGMVTSGVEAAVDLAVGAPLTIGVGLMGAGAGSAGKSGSSTLQAGLSGLGAQSIANKGYQATKKFVTNRVDDATSVASSIQSALKKK